MVMGSFSLVLTERQVHVGSWIIVIVLATIERVQVALILAVVAHFVPSKLYSYAAFGSSFASSRWRSSCGGLQGGPHAVPRVRDCKQPSGQRSCRRPSRR